MPAQGRDNLARAAIGARKPARFAFGEENDRLEGTRGDREKVSPPVATRGLGNSHKLGQFGELGAFGQPMNSIARIMRVGFGGRVRVAYPLSKTQFISPRVRLVHSAGGVARARLPGDSRQAQTASDGLHVRSRWRAL